MGSNKQPFLIAEIGINHNGDIQLARKMIDAAADAGFDAVKFQKRSVNLVYSNDYLESRIWSSSVIVRSYSFTVVSGIVTTVICLGGQKLIENSGALNLTEIMI